MNRTIERLKRAYANIEVFTAKVKDAKNIQELEAANNYLKLALKQAKKYEAKIINN